MDISALPPELGTPQWWSVFLTSPALAGVAAVLAAAVALWGVNRRIEADKEMAAKARAAEKENAAAATQATATAAELVRRQDIEDRDHAAWWSRYQWVDHELSSMEDDDAARVLSELADSAPDGVAVALVAAASSKYRRSVNAPRRATRRRRP